MRKHPLLLILLVLCLTAQLTGCGMFEPRKTAEPEPEPSPEPIPVYTAESTEIGGGLSALLPVCAAEEGFYCRSVEKIGEEIPDAVVREAKKKNREP